VRQSAQIKARFIFEINIGTFSNHQIDTLKRNVIANDSAAIRPNQSKIYL
jgi:hypothetical protein